MRFYLSLIISSLFLFSCSSEKESIPKEVVTKKAFTNLLIDMEITEAYYNNKKREEGISDDEIRYLYKDVFKKHEITKEEFEINMDYYAKNFDLYHSILEEVHDEISARFSEAEAKDSVGTKPIKK